MPSAQVLMTGIAFGESPRWRDGRVWFSDWLAHEVIAVDLDGASEVVARVPAFPFCIDSHPDGGLLVVAGSEGRLLYMAPDASPVTYADLSALDTHPWNDIVVDGRGNAYVNNIGFDFPGGEFAPGIVALVTPDGTARSVADGLAFPNGMAVTPDNATLIVAESYGNCLTAFDIEADGSLANRRMWAHVGQGVPDGICLDAEGAVWYADVPNQACVRVAHGGAILRTVSVDRGCFSCTLGGPERRTLFMVAQEWGGTGGMSPDRRTGQLLCLEVEVPGAGWP
jgi:sugar lactone lactonase YvrE